MSGNEGFTPEPLSDPGSEATVDIVFVHGLHGNRKGTWEKSHNFHSNIFWPKDILPRTLPQARILTWGYDSKIAHFWNRTSVSIFKAHSARLLHDLAQMRRETHTHDRPIIFIAHSLGGLVCANALVTAQVDTESHIRETAASVKGMMFLGTPHAGSDKQKWADIGTSCVKFFKDDVNKEVLEILAKDSTMLAHLGEEFPRYLQLRNQKQQDGLNEAGGKIEVICYFEENKSMVGVIVTRDSAMIGGYPCHALAGNHMDMCKFDSEKDKGYIDISSVLKRWIQEITSSQRSNEGTGSSINQSSFSWGPNNGGINAGVVSGGSTPLFGNQTFNNNYGHGGYGDQGGSGGYGGNTH